jgi:hypothetical protein
MRVRQEMKGMLLMLLMARMRLLELTAVGEKATRQFVFL